MGRPNKKVTTGVTEDDPPTVEDQSLEKDAPQDPSSSKASEAEEQRQRIRRASAEKAKRT